MYRAAGDIRLHSLLLPNSNDDDTIFAIESKQLSRLVGVLIRNETVFTLSSLTCFTEDKQFIWKLTGSAEFYRVDTEALENEVPPTSLCRAGRHVLCAVAHSHRLIAFEYTNNGLPPKEAGDQRFEEEIVHVDALNADTGPLVAIAFADESIRLYRNESTQPNEARFALHETFRVTCENVRKLLFAGERLLVAERSDDEEVHRVWSCRVVGERLFPEGEVILDTKISLECWCYDRIFQHIYCVDSAKSETFKFRVSSVGIISSVEYV